MSISIKKVLFDGTATQSSSRAAFHGGGEYAKYMLRAAIENNFMFDVVFGNWLYTDAEIESLIEKHNHIHIYHVANKQQLYKLINSGHYDVFYSALPAGYRDYAGVARMIGVIHGLRGAELPWDYYRYKYEIKLSKRIEGWIISHCQAFQNHLKKKHIAQSRELLHIKDAKFIAVSYHTKNAMN